jgi:hypothetical protein
MPEGMTHKADVFFSQRGCVFPQTVQPKTVHHTGFYSRAPEIRRFFILSGAKESLLLKPACPF